MLRLRCESLSENPADIIGFLVQVQMELSLYNYVRAKLSVSLRYQTKVLQGSLSNALPIFWFSFLFFVLFFFGLIFFLHHRIVLVSS